MENITLRERKAVLIIWTICTSIFSLAFLLFGIIEKKAAAVLLCPLILWGLYMILAYYRHSIVLEPDRLIISKPFRAARTVCYTEIRVFLLHRTYMDTSVILLDHKNERLLKFAADMSNAQKAVGILEDNLIPRIDLSAMLDRGENIDQYLPALTRIERFCYHAQINVVKTAKDIEEKGIEERILKAKKTVNIIEWGMVLTDIFAFIFLKGKLLTASFVFVLLLTWGMYVGMYPYLFLEINKSVKTRKYVIELPPIGTALAAIFCLISFSIYNCDPRDQLISTGIYALILFIPFLLKLRISKKKPDFSRFVPTIFIVLLLAFTTLLPVHYLATFGSDGHEAIIVTDKDVSSGKFTHYSVYADWRGENQSFSISRREYMKIEKGDQIQVCLRKSIFGLQYWSVHTPKK